MKRKFTSANDYAFAYKETKSLYLEFLELGEEMNGLKKQIDAVRKCDLTPDQKDRVENLSQIFDKDIGEMEAINRKLSEITEALGNTPFLIKFCATFLIATGTPVTNTPEVKSTYGQAKLTLFFRAAELFSHILPAKMRTESFEPAYFDAKADFLVSRRRYKGTLARIWLTFWFVVHYFVMIWQAFSSMLTEKVKKAFWMAFGGVVGWFKAWLF